MTKNELRAVMKKRLGSIKDRSSKEAAATREALAFAKNRGAEKVAVFLSFGDEISTDGLIGGLLSGGATVCAPITDGNGMVFVKIKNDTKYSAGAFGIRIPEYSDAVTDFDIVFHASSRGRRKPQPSRQRQRILRPISADFESEKSRFLLRRPARRNRSDG
jgi:5-formyltetrahydrofolate cyclo-ligase